MGFAHLKKPEGFIRIQPADCHLVDESHSHAGPCISVRSPSAIMPSSVYRCSAWSFNSSLMGRELIRGEVRTINDRNICERRSCMKNDDKSPTFKFVSGEERRPSEVQRVSRSWRLPGATHSSVDLAWIRKWQEIQAPEMSELESVELELGNCCSDLDKHVSDEICWTRKRQFEIPIRL